MTLAQKVEYFMLHKNISIPENTTKGSDSEQGAGRMLSPFNIPSPSSW